MDRDEGGKEEMNEKGKARKKEERRDEEGVEFDEEE